MKKFLNCLAAIMMMGALCACGDDKIEENSDDRIYVNNLKVEDYVTLGEYKNIAVTVSAPIEVTDDMVESEALAAYLSMVTEENGGITDRAIAEGDTVIFDYEGKRDGVAFDGGTAQDAELTIGSGRFIPGFEEGMIGLMPGETADLNLTFPENYGNDLAGADVVFTVKIHFIMPTEMKDEVVAGFGSSNYTNVAELTQTVKESLEHQAKSIYDNEVSVTILEQIAANSTYNKLPQELVDMYKTQISASVESAAAQYGLDAETMCQYMYGMSFADYLEAAADVSVKQILTAQMIAVQEGLVLTDEQLEARIDEIVAENGWSSEEEFRSLYNDEMIRESVMYQDVSEFLAANAVITHKE